MYIPERFKENVDAHILGNLLNIRDFPLILAITGEPGMGKTFQLRKYLELMEVSIFSVSSADLEDERAGEPAKLLERKYREASDCIGRKIPAVLVIDDVDTTLGEWEQNTGTVNHQNILAFLMHLADSPCHIERVGAVNRVPVFFTANHFEKLYHPLVRFGRANRFEWKPRREEKIKILTSMFGFTDDRIPERLVDAYPTEPISFFSSLRANENVRLLTELSRNVVFRHILTNPICRKNLLHKYEHTKADISWEQIIRNASKETEA